MQGTVTYPPLLEHLEFLECSLKEGAAEHLAKTGHSVKYLLSEQGNGYPLVLVSAMGISPLSQPLAVPRSRKVSFELGSLDTYPCVGNLPRSQSWKGPQKSHAPTSHIGRKKQKPRLRTDLPELMDWAGDPCLVPSPALQPALFICSTSLFQPWHSLFWLWNIYEMSQKITEKWSAIGAKGRGSQGGRQVSGQFWGRVLACPLLSFSLLPLGTKGILVGFPASVSPGPWCGQTRAFDHKISNSHLHPHKLHPTTQLQPTKFASQPKGRGGTYCSNVGLFWPLCLQRPLSLCLWTLAYPSKPSGYGHHL